MPGYVRIGGGGSVHVDRCIDGLYKKTTRDKKGKVGDVVEIVYYDEAGDPHVIKTKVQESTTVKISWIS